MGSCSRVLRSDIIQPNHYCLNAQSSICQPSFKGVTAWNRKATTAILSEDVAGYSRLMEDDEAATVRDGDGVNVAARLESIDEPGGICVSKTEFDRIETKLPFGYACLGEQTVESAWANRNAGWNA